MMVAFSFLQAQFQALAPKKTQKSQRGEEKREKREREEKRGGGGYI
jgi:hypothetical protein